MKSIHLALAIHNHQPVGNFDSVFEQAYQRAYLPFHQTLEKHRHIVLAQHFSGILFEWIDKHHPEFISRLRKRVRAGQIEMMTGGYYEPILTRIPPQDRSGQIKKLTETVRRKTGFEPTGLWVAERVWEPHLPASLSPEGVRYTVIDDSHFKFAGLREHELLGYYLTEEDGHPLSIFPICEKLRYTIPFRQPEETIELLREYASEEGDRLILFADDGEKFGVWPETNTLCYENGWLDTFFTLLEQNREWIKLLTPSQALKGLEPLGRVYLPTASYREMMEWALPATAIEEYEALQQWLEQQAAPGTAKIYLRGGFWRNFQAKYEESNNLHKRMLWTSRRLEDLRRRKSGRILEKAREHLYAGQCNCAYWHGVFGGLYLPHLRHALYQNLIRADSLLDRLERGNKTWVSCRRADIDADGRPEVVLQNDCLALFIAPAAGGGIYELDLKSTAINLIDGKSRQKEGYHHRLVQLKERDSSGGADGDVASIHDRLQVKEEGLENYLFYDWYRRISFLDHFLHPDTDLESFYSARCSEQGDFVKQVYNLNTELPDGRARVRLWRDGSVRDGDRLVPVRVTKSLSLLPGSQVLNARCQIFNRDDSPVRLWYGNEWIFSLLAGDAPDRYYQFEGAEPKDIRLASRGIVSGVRRMTLRDDWLGLSIVLSWNKPAVVWRLPLETVSLSEAGFERIYQASVVLPNWKISLAPGARWSVSLSITFNQQVNS